MGNYIGISDSERADWQAAASRAVVRDVAILADAFGVQPDQLDQADRSLFARLVWQVQDRRDLVRLAELIKAARTP